MDDPAVRDAVIDIFVEQSNRLFVKAKGFPAVSKAYLSNTVAIFIVVGDPRWKVAFPQHDEDAEGPDEYAANNENIYYCSLGAVIQNIQLAVTAQGLTSAWLSGGGETSTNQALSELLGYPPYLSACGTIPVGYPKKDVRLRYRRPLEQLVHWNGYAATQFRPQGMLDHYPGPVASLPDVPQHRKRRRLGRCPRKMWRLVRCLQHSGAEPIGSVGVKNTIDSAQPI